MKYYPIYMHLHCSHEASASIRSHMRNAKALGVNHIWTTEHDTRIGKPKGKYFEFFFPRESLSVEFEDGRKALLSENEDCNGGYAFERDKRGVSLRIFAERGERESILFHSSGKRHSDPLFARITVELGAELALKEGGYVCVEFVLSAQPPSYKQARLRYVFGSMPTKKTDAAVRYLSFPERENGKYVFNLLNDASSEIGGVDNALCNLNLIAANGAEIKLRTLDFYRELEYERARQAQIEVAEKIGEEEGVTAFVGFEVTGAGNHKNCFSTKVPVIEYVSYDYKVTNEQAVEHLRKYGAVYSWNHPFSGIFHSKKSKEEIFEELVTELVETKVYGASLIEVGYPCGRGGFSSEDYLRLWDRLSENGILITGNGSSDNHHATANGWTEGNNFCAFAGLREDEPPTEENFVKAFKHGTLWSGNPVVIKNLSFTGGGKEQGSLIRGRQVRVEFNAMDIKCDGYAVCVTNGREVARVEIQNGSVSGAWDLICERKYNFARVELYSDEKVLIAFSNPIYLIAEKTEIKER